MKYAAFGIAILGALVVGAAASAFLPLGYLEKGASVGELKLTRVILGGRAYLAVTGYDMSHFYRGDAQMIVQGRTCNIRIHRALTNHGQRSGEFAYLFDALPACSRVTFGERQAAL